MHGTAKPRVANRRGFRASDNGRGSDSGPGEIAPLISRANSEPSPMGKPQRALSLTGVPEDFQDTSPPSVRQSNTGESVSINLEDLDKPMISAISCVLMLVAYASLVAIFANALITSVFPVALAMHIPIDLIAVVLIPMVGNIAALFSSVVAATHDHMDLSLAVALGSATQIGMFLVSCVTRPPARPPACQSIHTAHGTAPARVEQDRKPPKLAHAAAKGSLAFL